MIVNDRRFAAAESVAEKQKVQTLDARNALPPTIASLRDKLGPKVVNAGTVSARCKRFSASGCVLERSSNSGRCSSKSHKSALRGFCFGKLNSHHSGWKKGIVPHFHQRLSSRINLLLGLDTHPDARANEFASIMVAGSRIEKEIRECAQR